MFCSESKYIVRPFEVQIHKKSISIFMNIVGNIRVDKNYACVCFIR